MDMFSLGHILFEIWTGEKPWEDTGVKRIRDAVQDGLLPSKLRQLLASDGKSKQTNNDRDNTVNLNTKMGELITQCYSVDPNQRITAGRLVQELTQLIAKEQLS